MDSVVDEVRLSSLVDMLRRAGGRVTMARRALLTALLQADGHLTAEDLAAKVQLAHPDVHLSTVYRTLDALEQLEVVDHVHLGHGRAVYHLTDSTHQHLVCEECGVVVEVDPDSFAVLADNLASEYGFNVRTRHFALLGQCSNCAIAR